MSDIRNCGITGKQAGYGMDNFSSKSFIKLCYKKKVTVMNEVTIMTRVASGDNFPAPPLSMGHSVSQSKSTMCWYLALKSDTEQRVSPQAGCSSTTCSLWTNITFRSEFHYKVSSLLLTGVMIFNTFSLPCQTVIQNHSDVWGKSSNVRNFPCVIFSPIRCLDGRFG